MNELSAVPFKEVGKTLQNKWSSVIYRVNWETYTSICSYGSVDPLYRSNVGLFHLEDSSVTIISSVKGYFADVLETVV